MLSIRSTVLALALALMPGLVFCRATGAKDDAQASNTESHSVSYLGIGIVRVDRQIAASHGLNSSKGVLVQGIIADSPAAKAGIRPDDIILRFEGTDLNESVDFGALVRAARPGRKVHLTVFREGKVIHLSAIVGALPIPELDGPSRIDLSESPLFIPDMPTPALRWRSQATGMEYEGIDSQLADFFGVKAGVLIRYVLPGSIAERAGLRAGDVVVKINSKPAASSRDMALALRSVEAAPGTISIEIVREHKLRSLAFKFGQDWQRQVPRVHNASAPE